MNIKRNTAVFAALLCLCGAVSCGMTDSSGESTIAADTTAAADITEAATSASVTSSGSDSGVLGEKIVPSEGEEEYDLGEYYISPGGMKLYFEPEEYPAEMALAMEKYFKSFADCDYDTYADSLYPSYIDEMNRFLNADYSYDLRTSFEKQCDSLKVRAGGEFTVTRIKIAPCEDGDITKFFEYPSSCFGKDYYAGIKDEIDKFYDAEFYVMVKDKDGKENLLLSEYEIVFAEKDGRFYTFG